MFRELTALIIALKKPRAKRPAPSIKTDKACKCELCHYVTKYGWPYREVEKDRIVYVYYDLSTNKPEDPRLTEYRQFLNEMDNFDAKQ